MYQCSKGASKAEGALEIKQAVTSNGMMGGNQPSPGRKLERVRLREQGWVPGRLAVLMSQ